MSRIFWEPKYFATSLDSLARQVLPPSVYAVRGVNGLRMMNLALLKDLDTLRKNLGKPITVNGGGRTQSGLRDLGHYGTYENFFKSWSMHKYGNALDFIVSGMEAWEVRRHIIENKHLYPSITMLEVGLLSNGKSMSWVHISSQMLTSDTGMLFWSPKYGYVTEERVLTEKL